MVLIGGSCNIVIPWTGMRCVVVPSEQMRASRATDGSDLGPADTLSPSTFDLARPEKTYTVRLYFDSWWVYAPTSEQINTGNKTGTPEPQAWLPFMQIDDTGTFTVIANFPLKLAVLTQAIAHLS